MNIKLNSGEILYVKDCDAKYELAKLLVKASEDLGHLPTIDEAKLISGMPENLNVYAFYFGSFSEARNKANATVNQRENPVVIIGNNYRRRMMDKRKDILDRIMELSFREHGNSVSWISEDAIKRDSILVYSEVLKAFGGLRQLKEAAKQRLWEEKHGKKKPKKPKEQLVMEQPKEESRGVSEEKTVVQPEKAEVGKMLEKERKPYRNWTAEEIKSALRGFYDAEGCLPTDRYLKASENFPTVMTIKKHLGNTREKWLKAIGVAESELNTAESSKVVDNMDLTSNEKTLNDRELKTDETVKEIVDLIGQNGKLERLGDMSDLMSDIKIEKQYIIKFGKIRATVNIFATIDE